MLSQKLSKKKQNISSQNLKWLEEFFYLSFSTQSTVKSRLYVVYEPLYFYEGSN